MSVIKMTVIPKPDGGTILAAKGEGPIISGVGELTYVCGSCGTKLFKNIDYKQVTDIVAECGKCGEHNEFPPVHYLS